MPNSTLEYKVLSSEPRPYSFCSSVIFQSLLAKFDNTNQFSDLFLQLFGTLEITSIMNLQRDFYTYQASGVFPTTLPGLVQKQFLPKLAKHLREHGKSFLQQSMLPQIEASAKEVKSGKIDAISKAALTHLLQVKVRVYTHSSQRLSLSNTIGNGAFCVNLIKEGEQYQSLMSLKELKDAQKLALQSTPTFIFQPAAIGLNQATTFTEEALSSLVLQTLESLPRQLAAISTEIPEEPVYIPAVATTELSLMRLDSSASNLPLRDLNSSLELPALHSAYKSVVALFAEERVESAGSWASSLGLTLAAGMTGGTLGLGITAGVAETAVLAAGGVAGAGAAAAMSVACIPVFVSCTLLTLVAGSVGKGYAHIYKEALQNVNQHILVKEYDKAVAVLDKEFNRFIINKALKKPFLTKAHYAVAHFFKGMCLEMLRQSDSINMDIKKAYKEYQQALDDANKTDAKIVVLLLHMKLIQLLRTHGPTLVSKNETPEALIKGHLTILNRHFNQSLTHLYWQARKSMTLVAAHCYASTPLSAELMHLTKGVLNIQSLFMLDGYQDGRGNYLQIFYSFFHAITVAYFQLKHPTRLTELGISQEKNSTLHVFDKLTEVFSQYNTFKSNYPALCNGQVIPDTFLNSFSEKTPLNIVYSSLLTHRVRGLSTARARAIRALLLKQFCNTLAQRLKVSYTLKSNVLSVHYKRQCNPKYLI